MDCFHSTGFARGFCFSFLFFASFLALFSSFALAQEEFPSVPFGEPFGQGFGPGDSSGFDSGDPSGGFDSGALRESKAREFKGPSSFGFGFGPQMPSDVPVEEIVLHRISGELEGKIDFEDVMQDCPDVEKIADRVMPYLQGFDFEEEFCAPMEEGVSQCGESAKFCQQALPQEGGFGPMPFGPSMDGEDEFKPSCPPDDGAVLSYCVSRMKRELEDRAIDFKERVESDCAREWVFNQGEMQRMCQDKDRFELDRKERAASCDESSFVSACIERASREMPQGGFGGPQPMQKQEFPQQQYPQQATSQQTYPASCSCSDDYKPVCSTNGATYQNSCQAKCKGAAIAYEGACVGAVPKPSTSQAVCKEGEKYCKEFSVVNCIGGQWAVEQCPNGCRDNACIGADACFEEGRAFCEGSSIKRCSGGTWKIETYCTHGCSNAACITPTDTPTPSSTVYPTQQPSPSATVEVTTPPTATPVPTESPTIAPTATPEPTPAPTSQPTVAPTPEPTPVPTEAPTPVPTQAGAKAYEIVSKLVGFAVAEEMPAYPGAPREFSEPRQFAQPQEQQPMQSQGGGFGYPQGGVSISASSAPSFDAKQMCTERWQREKEYLKRQCEQAKTDKGPWGISDPSAFCSEESFVQGCVADRAKYGVQTASNYDFEKLCARQSKQIIRDLTRFCKESTRGHDQCVNQTARMCEFAKKQLSRCQEVATESRVREIIKSIAAKECKYKSYKPQIRAEKKEVSDFSSSEIIPVVIAVSESVSESEISRVREIAESVKGYYTISGLRLYSADVRASRFSDLKQLPFVQDIQLDHLRRAIESGAQSRPAAGLQTPELSDAVIALEASKDLLPDEVKPWVGV